MGVGKRYTGSDFLKPVAERREKVLGVGRNENCEICREKLFTDFKAMIRSTNSMQRLSGSHLMN